MTTFNEPLIREVIAQIESEPSTWDQKEWVNQDHPCKTTFCFAGWATVKAGLVDTHGVPTKAGIEFAEKLGFPAHLDWEDSGGREHWTYPYEEAATALLGGSEVSPLFNEDAGRRYDGSHEYDFIDEIEVFKANVTRVTGIRFDEEPAAA